MHRFRYSKYLIGIIRLQVCVIDVLLAYLFAKDNFALPNLEHQSEFHGILWPFFKSRP